MRHSHIEVLVAASFWKHIGYRIFHSSGLDLLGVHADVARVDVCDFVGADQVERFWEDVDYRKSSISRFDYVSQMQS